MSTPLQRRRQGGFTLVEIAIVLVIIGLLLGGALKGQELIENSRVKNAANDMNGIIAAYNGYIDRYRRLPGDDGPLAGATGLRSRGGSWGSVTLAGDQNGSLDTGPAFSTYNEAIAFWQHVRAAGLLNGSPSDAGVNALPTNAWGGRVSVVNAQIQGRAAPRLMICMGSVPGKAARALDAQLDDGLPNNGSLRATQGADNAVPAAAAAPAYNEGQTYTICRDIT